MKSLSDAVNWYGRTYPALDAAGETEAAGRLDAALTLVNHAVYSVVRGLILRRKGITASVLPNVISEMIDAARRWIDSDRTMTSRAYLLEDISARFTTIASEPLLVSSRQFVSMDAPISGGQNSHGGEKQTWGDIISSNLQGRAGSTLSADRTGSVSTDGLVYDPDLDAYVRDDLVAKRKKHVQVVRQTVDTGIYSYAAEARALEEKRLEHLSPIRNQKFTDRIVAPSKAKLKRLQKQFRGQMWRPPKIGTSATGLPMDGRMTKRVMDRADFSVNKRIDHRMPFKCFGCLLFNGCASWLCGGYFTRGIHDPMRCRGPFLKSDLT